MLCCYPIPGKPKARSVCEAFAAGFETVTGRRARIYVDPPRELAPGIAVFYGVRPAVAHLWEQARREGRDWIYIDNSLFDVCREGYFRCTKNAIQHTGAGKSDGRRFARLMLHVKPMRDDGEATLICVQSDEFMRVVAGEPDWLDRQLERWKGQRVVVRRKQEKRPFLADLKYARRVVTWSSAAAVGALLEGVPAQCSPQCAAYGVADQDRERWASVLADNQWTLEEMRRGDAWRALQ